MNKFWMLGLFGGLAMAVPVYGGAVKTDDKLDVEITIGGQVRARFDERDKLTYAAGAEHASDDSSSLRSRLNFSVDAKDGISAFLQIQDSHTDGASTTATQTAAPGTSADAGVVLRQGYINIEQLFNSQMGFQAGRMALNYGNGRVITDLDWSNSPRHWDGLRLRYESADESTWFDAAYLTNVNATANKANSPLAGATNSPIDSSDDHDFIVLYGHTEVKDIAVDFYDLWERDGLSDRLGEKSGVGGFTNNPDDLSRHTSGVLLDYSTDTFYSNFELMMQWGNDGRDKVDATAYALVFGWNFKGKMKPVLEYEYIQASGDSSNTDGVDGRFQSPYHFDHKYLGYADVVGFSNVSAHKFEARGQINDRLMVTAAWHIFTRLDKDDGWYRADGTQAFPPTSAGSSSMGQEVDLKLEYQYRKNMKFEAAWAHFMEGTLARNADPSLKNQDYLYIQATLDF